MQILEYENAAAERSKKLPQCPKEPMSRGDAIWERLG
jgi:hypothetical protein